MVKLGYVWKHVSCNYDLKNYTKLPINNNKKHTRGQIIKCCQLIDQGYKNKEIMQMTKVSKDCIKKLRAGRTFKDISSNYDFIKNKEKE